MYTVKSGPAVEEMFGHEAVLMLEDFAGNQSAVAFFVTSKDAEEVAAILNAHAGVSVAA